MSVDAVQARLIWLQPTGDAVRPVGKEGAMRSGSVVVVVVMDVVVVVVGGIVVVVLAGAPDTSVVAFATFE